jgi:NAD(P)-dependent dehydrogenase (short-subunit alcohol dehydrogenase family)
VATVTFDLTGKVALVTGAGRGMGKAIAISLARAGADVAVADLDAEVAAELREMGRRAVSVQVDLRKVDTIPAMVAAVERGLGPVEVLVNNAGVNRTEDSFQVTQETWNWLMDVNLRAPFFCAIAVAKGMVERKHGKIINIASDAGLKGYVGHAAYGATKGGLVNLTRDLAVEWGPFNVQVNAVCPGATWTDMTAPAMQIPEIRDSIINRGVAGRICDPEEIGAAVVYLASDAANMVMGHCLAVDGGSGAK